MSQTKKLVREHFRNEVFKRDKNKCRKCGKAGVDAHHITDRNLMPNGGYVKSNGITVCAECHLKAERVEPGYTADELYKLIFSTPEKALADSQRLK